MGCLLVYKPAVKPTNNLIKVSLHRSYLHIIKKINEEKYCYFIKILYIKKER